MSAVSPEISKSIHCTEHQFKVAEYSVIMMEMHRHLSRLQKAHLSIN